MDRLQALLNGRKPNVKDPVSVSKVSHATERARLNNEDRKYNQIVYDNSLKQANLYNQSIMPNTAKDIGISFKINVYIIKLTQLLGNKGELEKMLKNYFTVGVSIQKLRGTTKESQIATDFFKKGEILSTYNELMLYIKTYATDIIQDDSFKSQIFNSSFNPLTQLLNDTAELYPDFFNSLPKPSNAGNPNENRSERKIYEVAREQCIGCYSLFNTMADFVNNLIFRPIVKEDVSKYIKDNRVKATFETNPMAPAPIRPNLPFNPAGPVPVGPPAVEPIQGDPFGLPDPQTPAVGPAGLPELNPDNPDIINDIITRYSNSIQRYLINIDNQNDSIKALEFSQDQYKKIPSSAIRKAILKKIQERIAEIKTGKGIQKKNQESQAKARWKADNPAGQAGPAQSPPQSPQAGPAPAPLFPLPKRQFNATQQAYETAGGTEGVNPQFSLLNLGSLSQPQNAVVWQIYKQLEETADAVIPPSEAGATRLYEALPQDIQNDLRRPQPDGSFDIDKATAIQDDLMPYIQRIQQIRIQWANQQAPQVDSATLYGLGKERNNNLVMNHILDFESMARRQARNGDLDTILELSPQLKGNENQIKMLIEKLRRERSSEPNMWGKGKFENKQGIIQRASMLPHILEFDPKAEALKRGKVMSGGYYNNRFSNGMNNQEWNYSGYGEVMNEEDTPFKRMIGGMPNPFAPKIEDDKYTKFLPYNSAFDDEDDRDYFDSILPIEQGHYYELEKPVDLDEQADHIRKNNENYKVMTGKMKNVKYRN